MSLKNENVTVCEIRSRFDNKIINFFTLRSSWKIAISTVIGAAIGAIGFYIFEGAERVDNTYDSNVHSFWRHGKVYSIAVVLILIAFVRRDWFVSALGGAWFGLHLTKDLAERSSIRNKSVN